MENSFYILSKTQLSIERLHICTWEFPEKSSYIEFGFEFSYDAFVKDSFSLFLAAPFIDKRTDIKSLLNNITDRTNGRFIFNDVVKEVKGIGDDSRDGSILRFESRDSLSVLPCRFNKDDGLVEFELKKPRKHEGNMYFRVLVTLEDTIALKKRGISQNTYIYDFKINETRNLPQKIYDIKNNNGLSICKIKNFFCLHAVPDFFEFSFVDSSKLRNIRKLESSAFQQYLPEIKSISKDCYSIMFLKDSEKESYSFFTVCKEEAIGPTQIAMAVGANIICSLLFAFSSFRLGRDSKISWYRQLPWEYYVAFGLLFSLCIYLFINSKRKLR